VVLVLARLSGRLGDAGDPCRKLLVPRSREQPGPAPSANEQRFRIGWVAKRTGVAAHTLRAWERRYGLLAPERTAGGGRLYSEADIARLRLLKQLTDKGHAIGSIAALSLDELDARLRDATRSDSRTVPIERLASEVLRERFMAAIEAFDPSAATRVLTHATFQLPVRELIHEVLAPLFQEVGDRWERGELTVAHEHAASNLLRTEVGNLLRNGANQASDRTAVACTLAGEHHEFGALLAALLASSCGLRGVYLGANVPGADIARAAAEARAHVVILSMTNDLDQDRTSALRSLRASLPPAVDLIVGGRGAEVARHVLSAQSIRCVESLERLPQAL
jgi:MerR family transcriptional regulator, light-induced transcriptional regulator